MCVRTVSILIAILCITIDAVQGQGYLYRPRVNGWIKAHRVAATWDEANTKCRHEGAELAAPITAELSEEIMALINDHIYTGQYIIDAKASYVPGEYSSTRGVPLDRMPVGDMVQRLDREDGDCLSIDRHQIRVVSCDKRLPYFCYRQRMQEDVLTECGTFDKEYRLGVTGTCYKFHKHLATWREAYSICVSEGAYLAVINDEQEAIELKAMFNYNDPYIGLQALKGDGVWTSVHGDPVNELFNVWETAFSSQKNDSRYRCTVLYYKVTLIAINCEERRSFLCEKEPNIKQMSF